MLEERDHNQHLLATDYRLRNWFSRIMVLCMVAGIVVIFELLLYRHTLRAIGACVAMLALIYLAGWFHRWKWGKL